MRVCGLLYETLVILHLRSCNGLFSIFYQLFFLNAVTIVTDPPEIIPEESVAKVMVPMEAANTRIGFLDSVISVNEGKH